MPGIVLDTVKKKEDFTATAFKECTVKVGVYSLVLTESLADARNA